MKVQVFSALAIFFCSEPLYTQAASVPTNGDCSVSGSTCPDTDCCGEATPQSGGLTVKRCSTKTDSKTIWTDPNDNLKYDFECPAQSSTTNTNESNSANVLKSWNFGLTAASAAVMLSLY